MPGPLDNPQKYISLMAGGNMNILSGEDITRSAYMCTRGLYV